MTLFVLFLLAAVLVLAGRNDDLEDRVDRWEDGGE